MRCRRGRQGRHERSAWALKDSVVAEIGDEYEGKDVSEAFETFVEEEFRRRIIELGERPDGRGVKEIPPAALRDGYFSPRARHRTLPARGDPGAGLHHARTGRRQAEDRQPHAVDLKRFMLHYNFRRSARATGRMFTGRREIGHGALAERAISLGASSEEDFPYAIRVLPSA